jgi:hypothetical protein
MSAILHKIVDALGIHPDQKRELHEEIDAKDPDNGEVNGTGSTDSPGSK